MVAGTLFDDYLEAPAVAACFAAPAMLAHMLEFEAALAQAQAKLGIVPGAAADVIARHAAARDYDLDALRRGSADAGNPAVALVAALTARVAADDAQAARWVHWGSTSQDVADSATMLAARAALGLVETELRAVERTLLALIGQHRETPMVARTLSQHAGPTTFGYKLAGWLGGLLPGHRRLRTVAAALPLQFGGASGTLAACGERGVELSVEVAARLGLRPVRPWHTERSAVRGLAAALGEVAAACGKVAADLVLMMQTEVAELAERAEPGRGGSSALPHKRNPVAAIGVLAAARRAGGEVGTLFANVEHGHERASGAWQLEWGALRDLFAATGGAVCGLARALDGIEVDRVRMQANLDLGAGRVMSESVTMALAEHLGRGAARELVSAALAEADASGRPLGEVLGAHAEVRAALGEAGLARALDPARYLGVAAHYVDEVTAEAAALLRA